MIEITPSLEKRDRKQLPKENREKIISRDGEKCFYCESTKRLTVDHVIPINHGGSDCAANLITSCHSCNSKKNGRNRLLPLFERYVLDVIEERNLDFGIDNNVDMSVIDNTQKSRRVRKGKSSRKSYNQMSVDERLNKCANSPSSSWRCGLVSLCPKCFSVVVNDRIDDACERISGYNNLYFLYTHNNKELRKIQVSSRMNTSWEYLAMPISENDKLVFVNHNHFSKSNGISIKDAESLIKSFAPSGYFYGNLSGKLGK